MIKNEYEEKAQKLELDSLKLRETCEKKANENNSSKNENDSLKALIREKSNEINIQIKKLMDKMNEYEKKQKKMTERMKELQEKTEQLLNKMKIESEKKEKEIIEKMKKESELKMKVVIKENKIIDKRVKLLEKK